MIYFIINDFFKFIIFIFGWVKKKKKLKKEILVDVSRLSYMIVLNEGV